MSSKTFKTLTYVVTAVGSLIGLFAEYLNIRETEEFVKEEVKNEMDARLAEEYVVQTLERYEEEHKGEG